MGSILSPLSNLFARNFPNLQTRKKARKKREMKSKVRINNDNDNSQTLEIHELICKFIKINANKNRNPFTLIWPISYSNRFHNIVWKFVCVFPLNVEPLTTWWRKFNGTLWSLYERACSVWFIIILGEVGKMPQNYVPFTLIWNSHSPPPLPLSFSLLQVGSSKIVYLSSIHLSLSTFQNDRYYCKVAFARTL